MLLKQTLVLLSGVYLRSTAAAAVCLCTTHILTRTRVCKSISTILAERFLANEFSILNSQFSIMGTAFSEVNVVHLCACFTKMEVLMQEKHTLQYGLTGKLKRAHWYQRESKGEGE